MARRVEPDKRARARALYVEGAGLSEIARALNLCQNTPGRWKKSDRAQGISWEMLRQDRINGAPSAVLRRLEDRLAELVHQGLSGDPDDAPSEERLLKLVRIIEGYKKLAGSISTHLSVMGTFARFCAGQLEREEIAVVRKAVELYLDDLKRKNS